MNGKVKIYSSEDYSQEELRALLQPEKPHRRIRVNEYGFSQTVYVADYDGGTRPKKYRKPKKQMMVQTAKKGVHRNKPKKQPRYKILCVECGHKFTRTIGWNTIEIRCPKCRGYDTKLA